MTWSEHKKGNSEVPYDHITCETPLGIMLITWKSWKSNDSFVVELDNFYLGVEDSLEDAKSFAKIHLMGKSEELLNYLKE